MTPFRLLLALSITTVLTAQPADLHVRIDAGPFDEQHRADVTVTIETKTPLTDPEEIKVDLAALGGLHPVSWTAAPGVTCVGETSPHWLHCQIAPAAAGQTTAVTMRVEYRFDDSHLGHVAADLTWRDRGFLPEQRVFVRHLYRYQREFAVTNGDDAGEGSLRQAILDANAVCDEFSEPCLIRFDLDAPATIFARTPLPAITARNVVLEGRGQVTIDGILLDRPANGITASEHASVALRGLTIQRFPENGVESTSMNHVRIHSSEITGNGSRGVTALHGAATIEDSVIHGNRRSGIFVHGANAAVVRSRIENNGASGIFVGPTMGTYVRDNVITGNAHFGVASLPSNFDVDISRRNRIAGNRLGQIDIGLDGPSLFPKPASSGEFQPPNGPTLLSATYDPATGITTVTGRLEGAVPQGGYLTYEVNVYATTAANELDDYLGGIRIGRTDFTYSIRGDLRGRFLTATSTRVLEFPFELLDRATSELGTPIQVH